MNEFIYWNGTIIHKDEFRINPDSRGLRYGDGLFETMKASEGKILLESLHFDRLISSLALLQFKIPAHFSREFLNAQVKKLLEKNAHTQLARVRLMAIRNEHSSNQAPQILIQSWEIGNHTLPASQHLRIEIFPDARKPCDLFSGIKSNNYLGYLMAADFAKEKGFDDALILNSHGRIADSSIANLFIITDGIIKTPPLSEGCVNGVYRRHLLACFLRDGILFEETPVTIQDLLKSDEVFLTNAIRGIRSVQCFRDIEYKCSRTDQLRATYETM